jgi:signal transduction histidine kinase
MSSGKVEPRLNRRTVTMDDTKVLKEVVQQSTLQPITPTRSEQIYVPTPQPALKPQGYAALTAQHIQNLASTPGPTFQPPKQEQPYQPRAEQSNLKPLLPTQAPTIAPEGCTVLVINASQSMAHEITLELSRTLPGSTILFAPTLSLALWILKRRQINLILSSAILPDGALGTLHQFIELMSPPPELVVISNLHSTRAELGSHPGYRFVELRRVSTRQGEERQVIQSKISELGANIRNDLNNPLQEIVAMAFVAHSSQGLSPMAEEALSAIQRAAGNMADVVNMLEDKIRVVVSESSAA